MLEAATGVALVGLGLRPCDGASVIRSSERGAVAHVEMEVGARLLGAAVPALRLESTDGLVSLAELAIAEPERNATDVVAWIRRME